MSRNLLTLGIQVIVLALLARDASLPRWRIRHIVSETWRHVDTWLAYRKGPGYAQSHPHRTREMATLFVSVANG